MSNIRAEWHTTSTGSKWLSVQDGPYEFCISPKGRVADVWGAPFRGQVDKEQHQIYKDVANQAIRDEEWRAAVKESKNRVQKEEEEVSNIQVNVDKDTDVKVTAETYTSDDGRIRVNVVTISGV